MSESELSSFISYTVNHSDNLDSLSASKTSNPKSKERFSSFGDSACGEPLLTQHILVDFAHDDEIDNEIVAKKICAFWKFIKDNPHIKNLKVKAEKNLYSRPSSTGEAEGDSREAEYSDDNVVSMDRGAVSMLEVVEEKGLITRTFEAKMPHSGCTIDSNEYKENEPNVQNNGIRRKSRVLKFHSNPIMSEAKLLCNTLTEWDAKHPKSMEPPAQPPALHHCIIQRQVYP